MSDDIPRDERGIPSPPGETTIGHDEPDKSDTAEDRNATTQSAVDRAWRTAYGITYVGASNTAGTALAIHGVIVDLRASGIPWSDVDTHPAVRAMVGHLAYLTGQGIGPESDDLDLVVAYGKRETES